MQCHVWHACKIYVKIILFTRETYMLDAIIFMWYVAKISNALMLIKQKKNGEKRCYK